METTGCTDEAFWTPMKKTAAYIDPIALVRSCCLFLHFERSTSDYIKENDSYRVQNDVRIYNMHICIDITNLFETCCNLRFRSHVPEHCPKRQGYESGEYESHSSVRWVSPVRPALFP